MTRQWFSLESLRKSAGAAGCLLLGFAVATAASLAHGQQRQQENASQTMRSADGVLSIQTGLPEEVRTDEQFQYKLVVTNTTDQLVLHDIKLKFVDNQGVSIESVQKQDQQQQDGQQQENADDKQQANQQQTTNEKKSNEKKSSEESSASARSGSSITIDKLEPQESKTIMVNASADQEGQANTCLILESYKPAICLTTKVVKPELSITKAAPERVNQCDMIELVYTISNEGTGNVGKFRVIDELADGLKTIKGDNRLAFEVDQLAAGDTRKFVANVFATKTGEFKSRAIAEATNSDLRSRSKNVGPNVVGVELDVNLKANGSVYSNRPAMFTATITNTGNATAKDVQVNLNWPEQAQLIRVSEMRKQGKQNQSTSQSQQSDQSQNSNQSQNSKQNASVVTKQQQSQQSSQPRSQDSDSQSSSSMKMASREMSIDQLEPGQSVTIDYTVSAQGINEIPTKVEALFVCAVDEASDIEDAQARTMATAMARVQVIRLPALQIYTIDDADPVPTDDQVTYTINVRNEGDAKDSNVKITAILPDALEFESAKGPTKFEQQKNQIVFQPIKELGPGEEVEYTLTAKATSEGNVKLQVELESQGLASTVQSAEPTQLFSTQSSK